MSDERARRRERQDNLLPEAENQARKNPDAKGLPSETGPDESIAGQDRDTGAGTGGATESEGRPGHHEGVHLGNQPNS